jgi:hypothetical protein
VWYVGGNLYLDMELATESEVAATTGSTATTAGYGAKLLKGKSRGYYAITEPWQHYAVGMTGSIRQVPHQLLLSTQINFLMTSISPQASSTFGKLVLCAPHH